MSRPRLLIGLVLASLASRAPAQCPWERVPDAPLPRLEAASIVIDDQLVLLGGFWSGTLQCTDRVDVLDPQTQTWSMRTHMPTALTHHGVALVGRTLWVVGGFVGDHPGPVTAAVWRYDLDADSWSAGPSLPAIRGAGALVAVGTELHYFGGVGSDKDVSEGDHWLLDSAGGGWSPLTPMPDARNHFSATLFGGKIYAFGGQYRHNTNPVDLDHVHAFDLASGQWQVVASLPYGLSHAEPGTFVDAAGPVLAGGRSNVSTPEAVERVLRYDAAQNRWSDLPPLPKALIAPAVKLIQGVLQLSGGGTTAITPTSAGYRRPHADVLPLPLRSNSGGSAFLGPQSAWCDDDFFLNGRTVSNPGIVDVGGTDNDELYRSERQGSNADPQHLDYRFLIGSGPLHVRLHFVETFWGSSNRRRFGVRLEGLPVIEQHDIFATVGRNVAEVFDFDVLVEDGWLDLALSATLDRPTLAGIELEALAPGSIERYCEAGANSVGAGAAISFRGRSSVSANDFTLLAGPAPVGEPGLFIQGPSRLQVPFGAGFRCVGGGVARLAPSVQVGADGWAVRTLDLANPVSPAAAIAPGSSWNFQLWYRDSQLGGFNLSDGLSAIFAP